MNIDTITTVLMIIAPSVSSMLTVLLGFVALVKSIKSIKNNNIETVVKNNERIQNLEKKLNTANSKLASIEKFLQEKKGR